jgi:predicted cobalt transporter CbtA
MGIAALLRRGLAAGAAAGVASAVVAWFVVEPALRRALVVEEAAAAAAHHRHHAASMHHHAEPLVSRSMQELGGLVTTGVAGVLFGVVFAVVFARARHRLPARTDFGRAVVLALLGFGVFALLPGLKYPASPPGVGDPATVGDRTLLYVASIVLGVFVVLTVSGVDRLLAARELSAPRRQSLDALTAVALVVVVLVTLPPSPDGVPATMPAALLWDFRVASLAQLATMWAVMGVTFGLLAEARERRVAATAPAPA